MRSKMLRLLTIISVWVAPFLLLVLGAKALAAPPVYWHPAGSGLPSDIQALAAAPSTLYAGAWGDGVYRSTDHGVTWLTATAGLTLPMYTKGGLAVNSLTPTILFAGDYFGALSGGGVYRSINGGLSWTVSLRDVGVETLLVHPLTPTLVLAGTVEDGLYRSFDIGDSWESGNLPAQRVQILAAAPISPGTVYAGADNDLYGSVNGGMSWTLASALSSTVTALAAHPLTPTHLYAGTRQHGLWRSRDGGASWLTDTVTGLPGDAWVTSIAVDPISPTVLYAGVWQGRVYRSRDGGAVWEDLGYLGTVQDVLVHPQAPGPDGASGVIYAATSSNGVFRGSMLDHLTMAPIASPQYVYHTFPISLTARDALGFPLFQDLTGLGDLSGLQVTLSDATGSLTPTMAVFVDGLAVLDAAVLTPVLSDIITATVPGGPAVRSNPFDVVYAPAVHFTFDPIADQAAGRPFTITLTARDAAGYPLPYTGTADLVGVYSPTSSVLLPQAAGPFTTGSWSGQVVVTRTTAGMTLSASAGAITGVSNAFAVAPGQVSRLRIFPAPIPDQTAWSPFTLTLLAEDGLGNLAVQHTAPFSLTDSTHTLAPSSTAFEAGRWSGAVVITQAQNGVVVTATTVVGAADASASAADALVSAVVISATSLPFDVRPAPAPQADFTGEPRRGRALLSVQFTSAITGAVTGYSWNFGDGFTATTPHPAHTYRTVGDFDVTLVVTGPGGTSTVSKPNYITVLPAAGAPTATFSADVVSGSAPLRVNFSAVASGTVEGWLWNFGDGGAGASGPVITHTYVHSGVFDVSLTVGNPRGTYVVKKPEFIHVTAPAQKRIYLPLLLKVRGDT